MKDKTHFFFAYEGTQEKQFLTVNASGLWPQYEGTFLSDQTRWTYNAKVDHQLAQRQSLFFRYGAEDEYRPIITAGGGRRRAPASTSRCRASRRCSGTRG